MKKRGKRLFLLVLGLIFLMGSVSVNAAATTLIMDNDALPSSGTINPWMEGEDFGGYNMPSYLKSSRYYNGDARRGATNIEDTSSAGGYGCQYVWQHGTPAKSTKFYAYLWDDTFCTPAASYGSFSALHGCFYGTINQNKAPVGWGYVGTATPSSYTKGRFYVRAMDKSAGYYLGADAIKVIY